MMDDLCQALESNFAIRKGKNSRYSLRAYARDLKLSPAYLSLVLNKKVSLKKEKIKKIVENLFEGQERDFWTNQLESLDERLFFKGLIPDYIIDQKGIKFTWAHYAVIEAFSLKGFQSDVTWIGQKLGLLEDRVEEILTDLLAAEVVFEENQELKIKDISFSNILEESTSEDRKRMQKDILNKSFDSIDRIDISQRDHTSMTIAMNREQIKKVKERIKNFRRELCCELSKESEGHSDEVYQLQFSVFPLTLDI